MERNEKLIATLAEKLNVTEEAAASLIKQEVARKAAGERYRQSDAYKTRLLQQKLVRQALKQVEL